MWWEYSRGCKPTVNVNRLIRTAERWVDGEYVGYACRCPWVIRGLRLLSVGCACRLHPRLCACYRTAVRIRVYQEYALVSLRASTRNLILDLSNATRPRPYQLHGIWGLSLLIYEMDVSSGRDVRLVRPPMGESRDGSVRSDMSVF